MRRLSAREQEERQRAAREARQQYYCSDLPSLYLKGRKYLCALVLINSPLTVVLLGPMSGLAWIAIGLGLAVQLPLWVGAYLTHVRIKYLAHLEYNPIARRPVVLRLTGFYPEIKLDQQELLRGSSSAISSPLLLRAADAPDSGETRYLLHPSEKSPGE